MRSSILALLKKTAGYISGEDISRQLSISRTAVWKHIQALKQKGYQIESHSRCGYRLLASPDLLLPYEITPLLLTKTVGSKICYMKQTRSTNEEAKLLAQNGCPDGTIVLAEEQLSGRGRLTRGWFSPFGKGIWLAVVLRPPFRPQQAPKCTLMAAVAVRKAIAEQTGLECGIKWPNDILWQNRKLVGILTELNAEMDLIHYIVVGIGINVNINEEEFLPEIRNAATSLSYIQQAPVSRLLLLKAVLQNLDRYYTEVCQNGFDGIFNEWRHVSATLGKCVHVAGQDTDFTGVALDIDEDGALLVRTEAGVKKVLAGDVSIRAVGSGGY